MSISTDQGRNLIRRCEDSVLDDILFYEFTEIISTVKGRLWNSCVQRSELTFRMFGKVLHWY